MSKYRVSGLARYRNRANVLDALFDLTWKIVEELPNGDVIVEANAVKDPNAVPGVKVEAVLMDRQLELLFDQHVHCPYCAKKVLMSQAILGAHNATNGQCDGSSRKVERLDNYRAVFAIGDLPAHPRDSQGNVLNVGDQVRTSSGQAEEVLQVLANPDRVRLRMGTVPAKDVTKY